MKRKLPENPSGKLPTSFLSNYANPAATAFALTNKKEYAERLRKCAETILSSHTFNPKKGFFYGYPRPVCYYYELLHDQIDQSQKKRIREILKTALIGAYKFRVNKLERYTLNEHDWQADVPVMLTMAAVLYSQNDSDCSEVLEYLYDLWHFRGPVGGRNSGGWGAYGYFQTHAKELFQIPFFFSRHTQYNHFDTPWYKNVCKRDAFFLLPGSNGVWGDNSNDCPPLISLLHLYYPNRYSQLRWAQNEFPLSARNVVDMILIDWFALPALTKKPLPTANNPSIPIKPVTDKGLFLPDTGTAILCNSPEEPEKNVKVLMRSNPFGLMGHGHPGNNAFVISYGGVPMFDGTGYYSSSGDYFSMRNFKHTRAKNSILPCGNVCEGLDSSGYGWIPRFMTNSKIGYCLGDASNAFSGKFSRHNNNLSKAQLTHTKEDGYINPGVTRWRRHLSLLENGVLVVYDELEAKEAITWTYMLNNKSRLQKVSKNQIVSVNNSKYALSTLYTTEQLTSSVSDKWFGKDRDEMRKRMEWKYKMGKKRFNPDVIHWRARLEVQKPVKKLRFLNVIRPVDGVDSFKPVVEQLSSKGRKQIIVDNWMIEAELNADKPSCLKIWNRARDAALVTGQNTAGLKMGNYSQRTPVHGASLLIEQGKNSAQYSTQSAVDRLPDAAVYGNLY